ncbi:hypothetical protein SmJEL517_g04357 [Synchytrium microbalum]|uniref:Uncharacterized protein n=1 Tax=Synchytrium microbalum TaxID=1806994 RepID=A0A507C0H1_9FUNG|nr:uncharacterized protein SmJEL517_g04357 [Synchytrium microbalum]TPX32549.1 hypothetical protein SmJEL517_g04357 [Synchytrium microbalum]
MAFLAKWASSLWKSIPKSTNDLRWIVQINPDLAPHVVRATEYRAVAPGSDKPFTPTLIPGVNDKINNARYFLKDSRRAYPQTVVFSAVEIQKALSSGTVLSITAGATDAAPAAAPTSIITENKLPPIINNKYTWKNATPYLKPDSMNLEFSIQGRT